MKRVDLLICYGCFLVLLAVTVTAQEGDGAPVFSIKRHVPLVHDDGEFLWFHPRACAVPTMPGHAVMTLQKHLKKSDYYSGVSVMYSEDAGVTWTEPVLPEELDWYEAEDGTQVSVCDVTPGFHAPTGKVIAIGIKVVYLDGVQQVEVPRSHDMAYAVHDPETKSWSPWQFIELPDPEGKFHLLNPGCVQWLVEKNGELVVPVYFKNNKEKTHHVTVLRCDFDGETLTYNEHGEELSLNVERGLVEPSMVTFNNQYFLTLRNDVKGYVTVSNDGMRFATIKPWTFDDGEELGSYNTQQHWISNDHGLYLVYTRRAEDNGHIPRHRAPLFIAQVDPYKLQVIRSTEKIVIYERGASLGNFGACSISGDSALVTVSEGIWNDTMRKKGADGSTFVAKLQWRKDD